MFGTVFYKSLTFENSKSSNLRGIYQHFESASIIDGDRVNEGGSDGIREGICSLVLSMMFSVENDIMNELLSGHKDGYDRLRNMRCSITKSSIKMEWQIYFSSVDLSYQSGILRIDVFIVFYF